MARTIQKSRLKRCPNGSRRNKKTGLCVEKSEMIKKQRIQKQRVKKTMSVLNKPSHYLYSIWFSIDASLINKSRPNIPISKITKKHIDEIIGSVKYNARKNSNDDIITHDGHIVKLLSCNLDNVTRNIFTFHIKVETDVGGMLPDDLVYAVFPSAYDNTDTYYFIFTIDGATRPTYYKLIMNDVPTILRFE